MRYDVDLRLSRRFRFTENTNFEVLAEAFNLFNHLNVTDVSTTQYSIPRAVPNPRLVFNPLFGTADAAGNLLFRERQVQLAVRMAF